MIIKIVGIYPSSCQLIPHMAEMEVEHRVADEYLQEALGLTHDENARYHIRSAMQYLEDE